MSAAVVAPPPSKRPRPNDSLITYQGNTDESSSALRTSSLPAPTLKCTGHKGSIYALEYAPSGHSLCSASFDKTCLLWRHSARDEDDIGFGGEGIPASYDNYAALTGHKNAVLDCHWVDDETIVTASADKVSEAIDFSCRICRIYID